jgi:quercetin dioxygenase-like cupin family protein
MKSRVGLLCAIALMVVLSSVSLAVSQRRAEQQEKRDPLTVGPEIYRMVLENDRIRALEVTFAKGASIAVHDHPDHMAYAMTAGKLEIAPEGKDPQVVEVTPGMALWIPAEAHSARNAGDTELKLLVVELKEPARRPQERRPSPAAATPPE